MVKRTSNKPSVSRLVAICHAHGLRRVLISPGSRNAPLSLSFAAHGGFDIHVVPDERAAAFMAIGMAQVDKMPSILVCTSGSAVLDYAPAVAEAYYQRIPMLVISADRPVEWVDQLEGQTMRQTGVLSNFVNKEVDLPQETEDEVGLRFHDRLVNEAIAACFLPVPAPVHMNCHLDEPLYTMVEENVPLRRSRWLSLGSPCCLMKASPSSSKNWRATRRSCSSWACHPIQRRWNRPSCALWNMGQSF